MNHIAYTQRVCDDSERIEAFLQSQRVGILGLNAGVYPYVVPVNYLWHNGDVYFHGMGSGRKVELLREEPPVSFTVFQEYGTATAPIPCHADTAYFSVMLFGQAKVVIDPAEAAEALQALVDKLMPDYYRSKVTKKLIQHYKSSMDGNGVAVFRVTPAQITAKENRVDPHDLFTPSAT
jgi:nitroimidazol reductase NimA-like FMN-containing flavoprotein (pyridoxamine 5'-phosphate oxidase superfamily)